MTGLQSDSSSVGRLPTPAIMGKFLTLSNCLSILRALVAVPFAIVMLSGSPDATLWGMIILAFAALTDKFDGMLARKYNQVTEWGKILDPLADKIGMGIVAFVLVRLDLLPSWFFAAMVGRDVLILIGGVFIKKRYGVVLQSNQIGKWTIGAFALAMGMAIMRWSVAAAVFVWISMMLIVLSLVFYVMRFAEMNRTKS